jgi:hypothetical protein
MVGLAALLLAVTAASARDGDSDASFGGDGRVVAGAGWPGFEHATAMAVDPQGRIVVVAVVARMMTRTFVLRFNPDGSLDQSFSHDGIVLTDVRVGGFLLRWIFSGLTSPSPWRSSAVAWEITPSLPRGQSVASR